MFCLILGLFYFKVCWSVLIYLYSFGPLFNSLYIILIKFFKTYQLSANFNLDKYNYNPDFFKKFTSKHLHIESFKEAFNDLPFTWMIYNLDKNDSRFKLTVKSLL